VIVWVAPLIDNPLIVLVVFALMIPPSVRLPELVRTLALEKKLMLPVVPLPSCKVCLFVVPRTPVAVSDVAPIVPAETDAVGVPPATLVNANFALLVAVEPSSRSSVMLVGDSAFAFLWR